MVSVRLRGLAWCLPLLCLPAMADQVLPVDDQPLIRSWPAQTLIEQVVDLPADGRYAVLASGEQPVSVQTVDHIMGPSGRQLGRKDLIAAAGELKVRLHGQPGATGEIDFALHPFTELNEADDLPVLQETRLLTTELRDFQQRSWWLVVESPRTVTIELAGRYLQDLRLWRNGDWIEDLEPEAREIDPVGGEPLALRRYHTRLQPGIYRLVAYGGPGTNWAEDSDDASLYLRKGVPSMPTWGWWQYQTSPFGVDYWRVAEGPNLFELRPEEPDTAELAVGRWSDSGDPEQITRGGQRMDRNARDPRLLVGDSGSGERLLRVRYLPGERYRLAALHQGRSYSLNLRDNRPHLISVIGASDPRDTIDATVLALDTQRWREGQRQPLTEQLPVLGPERGWARRFNLMRELNLLIRVEQSGDYYLELTENSEAMAEWRLRPLYSDVRHGLAGDWQFSSSESLSLNEGLYSLSLRPARNHPGIAELRLRHESQSPDQVTVEASQRDAGELAAVTPGRNRYLRLNDFDQGHGGAVLRPLPLELDTPLPVTQAGDSLRRFEVRAQADDLLRASRADGSVLEIGLSPDGPWRSELRFGREGTRTIWVRNRRDHAEAYTLHSSLADHGPTSVAAMPKLSPNQAAELHEQLAPMQTGQPLLLEMAQRGERSHLLQVATPALYRLESTGLLATEVSLRDRVRVDMGSSASGGSGRNFLLQRHLAPGEYRMVSAVRGRSAGVMGLQAVATPLRQAGQLDLQAIGRTTVEPGEAAVYEIEIEQAGRYRIQAQGLEVDFTVQIEGPDGWPVVRPGSSTPLTTELQPGRHRIVVLPRAVSGRVLTSVRPAQFPPAPEFDGHGPHPLALNQHQGHRWRESSPRQPDLWVFTLPDEMTVRLALDGAMQAQLLTRQSDGWQSVKQFEPGQWQQLPAGEYRFAVTGARVDDRLDYSLRLSTHELVPGQVRQASLPSSHRLSLDKPALVRLSSEGRLDVQATLFDEQGRQVAFSDHRPDDWNMLISRQLPAGRYSLGLSGVGSGRGPVSLHYEQLQFEPGQAMELGQLREIAGGEARSLVVELPEVILEDGLLLAFASRSHATHGVSLEQRDGSDWSVLSSRTGRDTLGGFVLPPEAAGSELRLRVWPLDDVPSPIQLALAGPLLPGSGPGARAQVSLPLPGLQQIVLRREHHGLSKMQPADLQGWHWVERGRELRPVESGWIPARQPQVWLLGPDGQSPKDLQAVALKANGELRLPVGDQREVALEPDAESLRLWQLRSAVASVQVQALSDTDGIGWAFALQAPGSAGSGSVALALPGVPVERLQLARADQLVAQQPAELREQRLTVQSHGQLQTGTRLIRLPAGTAAQLQRPEARALRIALPAASVAALSQGDQSLGQIMHAGAQSVSVRLDGTGDTLWLANGGDQEAVFRVLLEPSVDNLNPPWQLAGRAGYNGWRELVLEHDQALRLAGDWQDLWQIDQYGQRRRVRTDVVDPAQGRRLLLKHGPEALAIWQSGALAGEAIAIESDGQHLHRFTLAEDGLLQLQADDRLIQRWLRGSESHWMALPAGAWQMRFAPMPGRQAGLLEVNSEAPETLVEGLSEPLRLGPGESQWYVFELERQQTIGIGLQSETDAVSLALFDAEGEPLGQGVAQMHRGLPAGRYLLRADLPADQPPLWLSLALVGTETPDDLIPASVRQRLMDHSR